MTIRLSLTFLAHCPNEFGTNVTLRAGSTLRDTGGVIVQLMQIIIHPKFNDYTYDFDFAILKFQEDLIFNSKIQPVKLPNDHKWFKAGTVGLVSGFGVTNEESFDYPRRLHAIEVAVISWKRCYESYMMPGVDFEITCRMLCAGVDNPASPSGNNDACSGDSVRSTKKKFYVEKVSVL